MLQKVLRYFHYAFANSFWVEQLSYHAALLVDFEITETLYPSCIPQ